MKAAVYEEYGPPEVVQIREVEKPEPKDNEVLIRTHATTVTSGDWRVRSLNLPTGFGLISRLMFGITRPRKTILGTELAGEVESVGAKVLSFKPGDQVFVYAGAEMGCHAEYKTVAEDAAVAPKPSNLSFGEAAALSFGGTTALEFFRRGKLQKGESVLVNGASGAVGSAAVQIAKHLGAEVTAVCSGANAGMVQSLGADHVIDYTQEDFTKNGKTYDIIIDTVGTAPYSRSKHSLTKNGRLLLVVAKLPEMLQIPLVSMTSERKIIAGPVSGTGENLRFLAELAQAEKFKPVIGKRYPFEQIAEAHRYVDSGHKKGNVVVTLTDNGQS